MLRRCYLARLVDRSIKTITILFLYLFINAAVSIVGILGEAAPTIFSTALGDAPPNNFMKTTIMAKINPIKITRLIQNSNWIVLGYGSLTCSQKITVEKRD